MTQHDRPGPISGIRAFLDKETAAGFMLFCAAVLALIAINSPLAGHYRALLDTPIAIQIGPLGITKPLLLWVNDGLMAIFFFLIGLEVKREILDGELACLDRAILPATAAVGGMILPAIIFVLININEPGNLRGWAIPAATDIAFALGVLALLGRRAPNSLKVMLLGIAIIDDLGAIVIIAMFYTTDVSMTALMLCGLCVAGLVALNRLGVARIGAYVLLGVVLWVCTLKSGVHATLAGVLTAMAVPLKSKRNDSPLQYAEEQLHTWVAFIILPVFAFANAGISLTGLRADDLLAPLPLGIMLGLLLGKQVGVFGFMAAAIGLRVATRPSDLSWLSLYGLSCLAGIGFTMSLFIGSLAFTSANLEHTVKLGVIAGSLVSGLLGYAVLLVAGIFVRVRRPTDY